MLKFFRKYNKYILAVGVALLMIAFLIQPTLSMFTPNPGDEVIGTIGSEPVTLSNQRLAGTQLSILRAISPALLLFASSEPGQPPEPLQWLLMLRDAETMGLWVSETELNELLLALNLDDPTLARLSRQLGISSKTIRNSLKKWMVIQSYKELVTGLVHTTIRDRLGLASTATQLIQQGNYMIGLGLAEAAFRGAPRLSKPLVERFLYDKEARVKITAMAVPSDRYLLDTDEPQEQELQDLFERYKDHFPGQGEPYGLGYRVPDRVKIEYLEIPLSRLRDKVRIEEADVLGYYDKHPEEFSLPATTPPAGDPPPKDLRVRPYKEVRPGIIDRLKDKQAAELGDRMLKAAQAVMLEDARGLNERGGYRVTPHDWEPVAIVTVAKRLHQQFDVLPVMHRYPDQWLGQGELRNLPGIGASTIAAGDRAVPFVAYVFSAKELLLSHTNHALASLRLQAKLPSTILTSPNGGRYLFRLTEVQANRTPVLLDEARDQVVRDAKRIAAYQRLQEDAPKWLKRLETSSMESLSAETGLSLLTPPAFPKRESSELDGNLRAPAMPGIGRNEAFVDRVFELAHRVVRLSTPTDSEDTPPMNPVEDLPPIERCDQIAVDRGMQLMLVRVDQFEPMDRMVFENQARLPWVGAWIDQSFVRPGEQNPLSIEALSQRVGFEQTLYPEDLSEETP